MATVSLKHNSMSVIGGTKGECTCNNGDGHWLENDFLSWTSRTLTDDRIPFVKIGKNPSRNILWVSLLWMSIVCDTEGHGMEVASR